MGRSRYVEFIGSVGSFLGALVLGGNSQQATAATKATKVPRLSEVEVRVIIQTQLEQLEKLKCYLG